MVNVVVDNYIRVSGLPKDAFHTVRERLTYPNPDYENAMKYGNGKVRFIPRTVRSYEIEDDAILLPRGVLMEFLGYLAQAHLQYQLTDLRNFTTIDTPKPLVKTRSYQEQLIKDGLIYPGPGFILQSPAGTGKTLCGLEFARREGRKTLWITHTKELANQTLHAASDEAEIQVLGLPKSEIGIIGMGKFKIGEFLTIATVQTLNRRQNLVRDLKYEFGTIIVDEVHHAPASTWKTGAHRFAPAITIGLTATSYRADGLTQMLFDCVGPVVGVSDRRLLIEENVLVIPEYCLLYTGINYSGATFADIVSKLVSDPRRNAIFLHIMTEIMQQNEYNVVLLLSGRVQHIEDLTKLCIGQGLQPIKLLGTLSELERAVAFEKLQSKKPRLLLATYGLLAEGFDYPPISHVILGTPFKNPVRLEQCAGRAQRPYSRKADSFVIDAIDENAMLHKQARTRRALALGFGMPMITYNSKLFGVENAI